MKHNDRPARMIGIGAAIVFTTAFMIWGLKTEFHMEWTQRVTNLLPLAGIGLGLVVYAVVALISRLFK